MPTILCIASYLKGQAFLRQCHREGWRTLLLTGESLQNADWPRDAIDEVFCLPDPEHEWNPVDMVHAVSYLARKEDIAKIAALDDFDVEKAAMLREHLRVGGMGETTTRYFRDKLAMREKAESEGIPIPRFTGLFHDESVRSFLQTVSAPYVLKPRTSAGAIGIQKLGSESEVWAALDALGDKRSFCLLEEFVAGEVFHVDSIVDKRKILWSLASQYGRPPLETSHEGRVFVSKTLPRTGADARALRAINADVLIRLGMERGVSHTEFLRGSDGRFLFLETSARVGGAHLAEMIEAAGGLNLWEEWAKLELRGAYSPAELRKDYASILICLARQEWPDLSGFDAPEVVWKLHQNHHAGLILRSSKAARVDALTEQYTARFYELFFSSLPPADKASH